jgi:hypothetical protein
MIGDSNWRRVAGELLAFFARKTLEGRRRRATGPVSMFQSGRTFGRPRQRRFAVALEPSDAAPRRDARALPRPAPELAAEAALRGRESSARLRPRGLSSEPAGKNAVSAAAIWRQVSPDKRRMA